MRKIELDLNNVKSEQEVHLLLKEQLEFPDYYGGNLDALHDMLTEISENVCLEITWCNEEASGMHSFGKKLERVMEDAADMVEYAEDGRMYAVFTDFEPLDVGGGW